MNTAEITASIKRQATELGFAAVGVARAVDLAEEGSHLGEWLALGYHASMDWMARDPRKRCDPRRVLPDAKSVISIAMNYFTPAVPGGGVGIGKISRYAWGDDYHLIVPERLERLLDHIRTLLPSADGLVYVDTGPVMDKAWAVRSGIGWLGKHTNVITLNIGSWVFLGEILLDAELAYDLPITDHCGTCTACIDACPTGAIVQPYVLDASRCLSYWTIEHRGPIDPSIVPGMSGWVFGCDICQEVCPWNRFQQPTVEPGFQPRPENVAPTLTELTDMAQEEFSRRYRRSPVKRTKCEGLIRNARAVVESEKPSP